MEKIRPACTCPAHVCFLRAQEIHKSADSSFAAVSDGFRPVSDLSGTSTNFDTNVGSSDSCFPTVSDGFWGVGLLTIPGLVFHISGCILSAVCLELDFGSHISLHECQDGQTLGVEQ